MRGQKSRLLSIMAAGALVLTGALSITAPGIAQAVTCPTVAPGTGALTPPAGSNEDWTGCDLAGADLSNSTVSYSTLTGADLAGANLSNSTFAGTTFDNADLAGANVSGSALTETILSGVQSGGLIGQVASLPDSYDESGGFILGPGVDLQGADLTGADLTSKDLTGANLTGLDLAGADLSGSVLYQATLTGVTLAGANLTGTDLGDTDLVGVDLTGAALDYTGFENDNLSGRDFAGEGCGYCSFSDANLSRADLRGTVWGGSFFEGANLTDAALTDASLGDTAIAGARLAGATLTGLSSGQVTGTPQSLPAGWSSGGGYLIGPDADLADAQLTRAYLFNSDFADADLKGADLASATLSASRFGGANLTGANFSRAILTGAELTAGGAIMSGVSWTKATCPDGKWPGPHGCFPAAKTLSRGPQITVTVTTGEPGSAVGVSGSGFRKRERLIITIAKDRRAAVRTSSKGRFGPVRITVLHSAAPGAEQVTAAATARGQAASAWFTVLTPWTQAGSGPGLNSYNGLENVVSPVTVSKLRLAWSAAPLKWTGDYPPANANPPAIAGGLAYVTDRNGPLYAVSVTTGKALWSWNADTGSFEPTYSAPAVVNGVAYLDVSGTIYAIGPDGQPYWPIPQPLREPTQGPLTSAPTVVNGTVYAAGSIVQALNAASGSTDWTAATLPGLASDGSCNQPAVVSAVVYVSCSDGDLYALSAATGSVLWSYDTPDGGLAGPAVSGDAVYVTDTTGSTVYAISTKTGKLLWQSVTPATYGQLGTTPVVADGRVYVGAAQYLLAFSASTGKHAWATALPDHGLPFPSSPTAADGVVYEFVGDATEYAVSAVTGKILWSYPGGTTNSTALLASPVIANGALYVGVGSGDLTSLQLRH
jgi:uncharacterized protein YjbI with pentapeptide repeats/outer membrane protein assembly factor BamB